MGKIIVDDREPEHIIQSVVMLQANEVLKEHNMSTLFSYRYAFWLGYKHHKDMIQKVAPSYNLADGGE